MLSLLAVLLNMQLQQVPSITPEKMNECGANSEQINSMLALEKEVFEAPNNGWRKIAAKEGCNIVAAEVIKYYILYSQPYPSYGLKTLRWHAGQLYAFSNKNDEAIAFFKASYDGKEENSVSSKMWNEYVSGSLAFIQGDHPKLITATKKLRELILSAEGKAWIKKWSSHNFETEEDYLSSDKNLKILNNFITCFKKSSYKHAYGRQC